MTGSGVNWLPWRYRSRAPSSSSMSSPGLRQRRKLRGELHAAGRSLLAFGVGLVLASCYGATALFLEGAPLWTCVYGTLGVAGAAAFGMGISVRVRAAVGLMLPLLCSAHGRNFLLLASTSVLVSGPVANTMENSERAAASLICAAKLAANQTQQLMRNAATPLMGALEHIRHIGRNAATMATRVNKLIRSLSDGVRQIARTLKNILHFLVDIGDVCNAKLGLPYRKCRATFMRAQTDCIRQLGDFKFMCNIISGFMHLCDVAKVSLRLTSSEYRAVLLGVAWVLRHTLMSAVLVALDFLVFWLLDQVNQQVRGGVVARAPVMVLVQVEGSGFVADIMRDLTASFNMLQAGNVTVISGKCLPAPAEPDRSACFILGFLLGAALVVTLAGGIVRRSRRLICAYFHPDTEKARVHFLHQHILDERRAAARALVRAAARTRARRPEPHGRLQGLLRRLPGGIAYLSQMCVACGERSGFAPFVCDVSQCPGLFCKACFKSMGRVCDVCVRPASFWEDSQEELDSSEDERRDALRM